MHNAKLQGMVKGWFVGGFEPTLFKTNDVEVAVKEYKKGDSEQSHYHKVATEITVVISGSICMFEKVWGAGDIIVAEPGDVTGFESLSDSVTVVVKIPGALNDKYVVEQ